jgi:hypothetical protein
MGEGDLRVVNEDELFLLTEGHPGRLKGYDLWIGKREEDGTARTHYHLFEKDFERLANTNVVNLEAELDRIDPTMAENLRSYKIDWMDLSLFLGRAYIDEEDRRETDKKARRPTRDTAEGARG